MMAPQPEWYPPGIGVRHPRYDRAGSSAYIVPPQYPLLSPSEQQRPIPVIGLLSLDAPGKAPHLEAVFRQGLSESGFVEGKNVVIENRWIDDRYDLLPKVTRRIGSPTGRPNCRMQRHRSTCTKNCDREHSDRFRNRW